MVVLIHYCLVMEITINDLVFGRDGDDLIIGVNRYHTPDTPLEELENQIHLANWFDENTRVETIQLSDGTIIDTQSFAGLLTTDGDDVVTWTAAALQAEWRSW